MTFEKTYNERGGAVIKDKNRNIRLEKIAGRPGEGFIFEFTYKEEKIRLQVKNENIQHYESVSFKIFPDELEADRSEIIDLIKECFDFYMDWMTRKSNAEYRVTYSLS